MSYIDNHRSQVEEEYKIVLQTAQEIREYWQEKNRERFAVIAMMPPKPGYEAARAKLKAWKTKRGLIR